MIAMDDSSTSTVSSFILIFFCGWVDDVVCCDVLVGEITSVAGLFKCNLWNAIEENAWILFR